MPGQNGSARLPGTYVPLPCGASCAACTSLCASSSATRAAKPSPQARAHPALAAEASAEIGRQRLRGLVEAEGIRRGVGPVRQLTILGDGAAWILAKTPNSPARGKVAHSTGLAATEAVGPDRLTDVAVAPVAGELAQAAGMAPVGGKTSKR